MVQLGAQLYTVREHMQTPEGFLASLRRVAAMGYKSVQISGAGKDIPVGFIADALAETGLKCDATHISYDELTEDFDGVVAKHDAWNCGYVGIGGLPGRYRTRDGFYAFAREAGEIALRLREHGKTFIYHNHSHEFIRMEGERGIDILLDNTPPEFQFELDVYWVQNAGADVISWIRRVAGRMDVMHFKDMLMVSGNDQRAMAPIGQGNMNWPGIVAALNETGVKHGFVEQDICQKDPFECLADSLAYLHALGVK